VHHHGPLLSQCPGHGLPKFGIRRIVARRHEVDTLARPSVGAQTLAFLDGQEQECGQVGHVDQRNASFLPAGHDMEPRVGDRPEQFKHASVTGAEDDRRTHDGDLHFSGVPGRGQLARQLAATVGGNRCRNIAFHARLVADARTRSGQRGNHDQHRLPGVARAGSRDGFDAARVHACEIGRPHRLQ
jgi:hypothetical protein